MLENNRANFRSNRLERPRRLIGRQMTNFSKGKTKTENTQMTVDDQRGTRL